MSSFRPVTSKPLKPRSPPHYGLIPPILPHTLALDMYVARRQTTRARTYFERALNHSQITPFTHIILPNRCAIQVKPLPLSIFAQQFCKIEQATSISHSFLRSVRRHRSTRRFTGTITAVDRQEPVECRAFHEAG